MMTRSNATIKNAQITPIGFSFRTCIQHVRTHILCTGEYICRLGWPSDGLTLLPVHYAWEMTLTPLNL